MINENSLSLPASLTAYSDSSYRPWDTDIVHEM